MKTTKLLVCAVALSAALAAAKAQSQTLSATLIEITPGAQVTGTFDNGNFTHTYPAGISHFAEFDAFCVDPLQDLSYGGTYVYQIQDPATLANSDTIAKLVGGYLASAQTGDDAAAVQWAIWEITTELSGTQSLYTGNVRIITPASETIATLASQYLANVNSYTPVGLTYLTNPDHQDIVTWNVVPEPASVGLAAISGLLLLRRRR